MPLALGWWIAGILCLASLFLGVRFGLSYFLISVIDDRLLPG